MTGRRKNEGSNLTKQTMAGLSLALIMSVAVACGSGGSNPAATSASPSSQVVASPSAADSGGGAVTGRLPDGWPAEVALPAKVVVLDANKPSNTSMFALARIDGDTQAAFDTMKAQLTDAGYEIVGSAFTPSNKGGFGSISARGPKYTVAITFGPDPTGKTSQATINIAAVES